MADEVNSERVLVSAAEVAKRLAAGQPAGKWQEAELIVAMLVLVYADPSKLGGTRLRKDGTSRQHPAVVLAAKTIGRTENAIVLKVMNLRDAATGGSGMPHGGRLDRVIVEQFLGHLDQLLIAAYVVADELPGVTGVLKELGQNALMSAEAESSTAALEPETEVRRETMVRRGQALFRNRVLANFAHTCAVCGLTAKHPERNSFLLIASHIQPWRLSTGHQRLDPRNGLTLCAIHDRAFDWGFLGVDPQLRVIASEGAREHYAPEERVTAEITDHHGKPIRQPLKHFTEPDQAYLEHHRSLVFDRRFRRAG